MEPTQQKPFVRWRGGAGVLLLALLTLGAPLSAQVEFSFSLPQGTTMLVDSTTPLPVELWVKSTATSEQQVRILDAKWSFDFAVGQAVASAGEVPFKKPNCASLRFALLPCIYFTKSGSDIPFYPIRDGSTGTKDIVVFDDLDPSAKTMAYSASFQDSSGNFVTLTTPFLLTKFYVLPQSSGAISLAYDAASSGATILSGGVSQNAASTFKSATLFVVPKAKMQSLPAETFNTSFFVSWGPEDSRSGNISCFDAQVSEDGSTWTSLWAEVQGGAPIDHTCTTTQLVAFAGQVGKTYFFRVRAEDPFGNVEPFPTTAETQTTVVPFYIDLIPQPDRPECLTVAVRATVAQTKTPAASVVQGSTTTPVTLFNTANRTYGGNYCLQATSGTAQVCVETTTCKSFDVLTLNPLKGMLFKGKNLSILFPPDPGVVGVWEDGRQFGMTLLQSKKSARIELAREFQKGYFVASDDPGTETPLEKARGYFLASSGRQYAILPDSTAPALVRASATEKSIVLDYAESESGLQATSISATVNGSEVSFSLTAQSILLQGNFSNRSLVEVTGSDRAGNSFHFKTEVQAVRGKLLEQILVYPNPSSPSGGRLRIRVKQKGFVQCGLYNSGGFRFMKSSIFVEKVKEKAMALSLPSGVYFVVCRDENGFQEVFKWVILR